VSYGFHGEILFMTKVISFALNHANGVAQSFHVARRDLGLRVAVGCDAFPTAFDYRGEFLIGFGKRGMNLAQ
jgi:hypothetical protein